MLINEVKPTPALMRTTGDKEGFVGLHAAGIFGVDYATLKIAPPSA